ncbi:unnamed protein product [Owenia fusiformis]|uniref:RRM domain-containing protein n=1 Tax=Owenia fusiformis TaxID=6347 RepID=A0A8S4NMG8_OWEFU|nr:unnamed protein product [Owenia fusiformis]
MGDYGFVQNSNVRALSPVDFNQFSNNQSLFSPELGQGGKMQDEILLDKGPSKSQQLSPNPENGTTDQCLEDSLIRKAKSEGNSPVPDVDRKADPVSNVTSTFNQLGLSSDSANAINTSIGSAPNFWSTNTAEDSLLQSFPTATVNGTVAFQNFPPAPNSIYNSNISNMAPQQMSSMNIPQQNRRAITGQQALQNQLQNQIQQQLEQVGQHNPQHNGQHNTQQQQHNAQQHNYAQQRQQQQMAGMFQQNTKTYPTWSNAAQQQQNSWPNQQQGSNTLSPWASIQQQQPNRRSVPNVNPISAPSLKKPQHSSFNTSNIISPSRFRRCTSYPGQIGQQAIGTKPFDIGNDHREGGNGMMSYQQHPHDRNSLDSMRFPNLETHLLDIMRSGMGDGQDQQYKDNLIQQLSSMSQGSPNSQSLSPNELYSKKVFVGGLPPDSDEEEITAAFRRFGALVVDWPHKAESKSYFPPKGYCFLLFQDEMSVQALIEACVMDDSKLYWCVSSPTMKDKPVQIRPWNLNDSDFVMDGSQPLDPRKTIFVGGVPRPLRAVELAMIMDRLYGGVCYAGIDTDPELKYPKGAGRVAFSNQQSYIAAISARFVQLQHGDIDKRVEVKPYVLDDQMCDECQGARCGGKFAPFFCANVTCLQYYCEHCWAQIHARPGREFHKPLVKEGADRPRAVPFRWC